MLTCQAVAGLASDYLDGAMPAGRRLAVAFHLRLCPNCRAYLETLKRSMGLLRRAAAVPPTGEEEEDRLAALFRARRPGPD